MILHLTLHRVFFDKIADGTKKIEYREIKPHWKKRIEGREYKFIKFRNGYQPTAPEMIVEYRGFRIKNGLYEIILGRVLEIRNH